MSRERRVVLAGRVVEVVRGDGVARLSVEVVPGLVVRSLTTAAAFDVSGVRIGAELCVVTCADQIGGLTRAPAHRAAVDERSESDVAKSPTPDRVAVGRPRHHRGGRAAAARGRARSSVGAEA
jgi:molybdopterin-binding protein